MSEDEAINKATKFVQEYREKEQKCYDYLFSMKENDIPIQAIETILDLYQKTKYELEGKECVIDTMAHNEEVLTRNYEILETKLQQEREKNKELEKENERLKYLLTESGKIIDEYTNELENDTKKIIEYREKYLEKRIKNDK